MKIYVLFSLVCCSSIAYANFLSNIWHEYQGCKAYTRSNYDQAGAAYAKLLQPDPYDSKVNYNLGLVSYAQKKYETAEHYFDRAANNAKGNLLLQEQALFNQGNAYVEQKKLYEAIGAYSKVLEINPKNDRARHNLQHVQQLLQEQQRNDQSKDDQQNHDQQQDQQNKKEENQPKNGSGNQNQQQEQSAKKSDSKQSLNDDNQHEKDHQQSGDHKKSDNKTDEQHNDESLKNNSEKESKQDMADKLQKSDTKKANASQDDQKDQSAKKTENSKDTTAQDTSEKSDGKNEPSGVSKDQQDGASKNMALQDAYMNEMEQKPEEDERLDKRAVMVMQKMQEQEDYMQKQLLKMNVSKQGAFGYGQKNW